MNKTNLLTKLLLLCLLVVGSVNAWATDLVVAVDQIRALPTQAGLVKINKTGESSANTSLSSGKLSFASNKTGTFTIYSTNTDIYKIKKIAFTTNRAPSAFKCTDTDTDVSEISSTAWEYTPASPVDDASFSLKSPSSSTTATVTVTLTTASTDIVEKLSVFSLSESVFSFTTSAASTQIEMSDVGTDATTISTNRIQCAKSSSKNYGIKVKAKSGYKLKFISFYYYDATAEPGYDKGSITTGDVGTYTSSKYTWKAGVTPPSEVTFAINNGNVCNYVIYNIYVGYEADASGDAITLDKTLGTKDGSGLIEADATSFTPTAPTYADHTVEGYYATYSAGTYSNYIATAAGVLQPSVIVDETVWTDENRKWKKGGDATFYTKWKVNDPTVSCENNTVTIAAAEDATIYYTTDGETEPTSSSTPYSEPFAIAATTTVKAIAIQSGCTSSTVTSQECEYVVPQVATPTISPADGSTFSGASQTITLSCGTDGATIYYTVDGTTPTSSSNEYDPEDKPSISSTTTIKAIAIKADWTDSEVATATIKKVTSSTWGSWDFTNWSSTTKTGTAGDTDTWYDHEKSDGSGVDFTDGKGAVNKTAISTAAVIKYGSTNIAETDGLKFKADAYQFALVYNVSSALNDYHGNQYIWLFKSSSTITIPSVPANATIEIATETHKNTAERYVTLKNGSTTLTQTQGATSGDAAMAYQVCKWTNTSTEGDVVITPSAGLHIYYITVTANVETVPATIAASGWTSLASDKALNYADAEEQSSVALKAYAISSISKTSVTLTPHDAAPANQGMILKGYPGSTYNIPVATSASSFYNELSAAVTATPVEARSVYAVSEGKLKLFTGTTVPAGKAYLLASKVDPEARGLSLNFDEDSETTGIAEISSKKGLLDGDFYDLSGRKVAQPTKGLYIMNGRKVIVK